MIRSLNCHLVHQGASSCVTGCESRQPALHWERIMRKQKGANKGWVKPQITALGKIKDVAGAQGTGDQAATTKT